ncbi:MAG: secretin N-terminal domain-containing protein [Pirellula sp.]
MSEPIKGQAVDSADAIIRRDLTFSSDQLNSIETAFRQLFQGRVHSHPAKLNAVLVQIGAETISIEFIATQQTLRVEGAKRLVTDIAKLGLAVSDRTAQSSLKILSLNDNGQSSLSQLSYSSRSPVSPSSLSNPFLNMLRRSDSTQSRSMSGRDNNIALASAQEASGQPPNVMPAAPTGEQVNAPNTVQDPDAPVSLPLPQFEGVQLQMLPELDAVILRGRDRQLTDLAEIIKRLDEASRLSRPEIEVVPLQHVNSESLASLIATSQEKFIGGRQGRVSVSPLGSPNALLLIGWGESMIAMKELILKLDQPSSTDSSFTVIQLKEALAADVQTQLQSFFKARPGLSPVIQSASDSRSNLLIVHASPRDLLEIRKLIEQLDVKPYEDKHAAKVFQLKNTLAADTAKALQQALSTSAATKNKSIELYDDQNRSVATSGLLGSVQVSTNDRTNSIIVSCPPENMPLIEQFIEQLDSPGAVAKIKIFPIKNATAVSLVETLRSLLPTASGTPSSTAQLSSAPDESSLLPLRFTVDIRGNNIIAVGSEGDLKIVEAIIFRLDESDAVQRKSSVYRLKNSPAVDVALAINEFLRNKRQVENIGPDASNPFEQLEKEVVLVPEPVQNKLILSATPRYYDEISKLIEDLDQQPPQVMIQVMIAEIVLGNTDEFGIEMGIQDSVLFDRSLLGGLLTRTNSTTLSTPAGVVTDTTQEIVAATNTPGFDFNSTLPLGNSGSGRAQTSSKRTGGQGISNFSVGRGNETLGFGGLVLSASSENISFLLRALQDSRRLEILSRPQVLTLDNQQAFIQVGQRVPRIVRSSINVQGFQNSDVELENVGLIIGVTPRISPDGNVVMEIDAEKSKLGPDSEGIPISISPNGQVIRAPRVDTVTAQATVSAADGETIILGGLISRSTRTIHRQVPWLGDIPVIKHLFSYDLNEIQRTELVIIMTPHVVRSPGDMERLKQAEFARISWCEADVFDIHGDVFPQNGVLDQIGVDDDCPVVYPDIAPRGLLDSSQRPGVISSPLDEDPAYSRPSEIIPAPDSSSSLKKPSTPYVAVGPYLEGKPQ